MLYVNVLLINCDRSGFSSRKIGTLGKYLTYVCSEFDGLSRSSLFVVVMLETNSQWRPVRGCRMQSSVGRLDDAGCRGVGSGDSAGVFWNRSDCALERCSMHLGIHGSQRDIGFFESLHPPPCAGRSCSGWNRLRLNFARRRHLPHCRRWRRLLRFQRLVLEHSWHALCRKQLFRGQLYDALCGMTP